MSVAGYEPSSLFITTSVSLYLPFRFQRCCDMLIDGGPDHPRMGYQAEEQKQRRKTEKPSSRSLFRRTIADECARFPMYRGISTDHLYSTDGDSHGSLT